MTDPPQIPAPPPVVGPAEALSASERFRETMSRRRTIRHFAGGSVDPRLIENAVATAGTAPSGANVQPWRFVVVTDPDLKRRIREGAEDEERAFYGGKAPADWLAALEPLGTDADKPHLEEAAALIVVFEVRTPKPYYGKESVGIALGLLLASLHQAGLATLTHTPSPMRFLNEILGRPATEKPYVVVAVGQAAAGATVPDISRKPLDEVLVWLGPR